MCLCTFDKPSCNLLSPPTSTALTSISAELLMHLTPNLNPNAKTSCNKTISIVGTTLQADAGAFQREHPPRRAPYQQSRRAVSSAQLPTNPRICQQLLDVRISGYLIKPALDGISPQGFPKSTASSFSISPP